MRISVIIPCHNAERWIARALRSVMQQTRPVHEIIVVNDDSDDSSLMQIVNSGVPATVLNVKMRNAAAARNAGIEVATGEWLALLDADDVWYRNHIARFAKLAGCSSDVAFISNHDWISLEDDPIPMPQESICKLPVPKSGLQVDDFHRIVKNGSVEEYARLCKVAFPYLPWTFKLMYALGSMHPELLRRLIKAKRQVTERGLLASFEEYFDSGIAPAKTSAVQPIER